MNKAFDLPDNAIWSASQLPQALPLFIQYKPHFPAFKHPLAPLIDAEADNETISAWLDHTATQVSLEFRETEAAYPDIALLLAHGAPALLRLPSEQTHSPCFILVVRSNTKKISLLQHDGDLCQVTVDTAKRALSLHLEAPISDTIQYVAQQIGSGDEADDIAYALLCEQLISSRINGVWLIRLSPSSHFLQQIRSIQLPKKIFWIIGLAIVYQLLSILAWVQIGKNIIGGTIEPINLQIWALLLLTLIPIKLADTYIKNRVSLYFGMLMRSRLLHGILKLKPEQIRHHGSSHFFSTLMNIESLEVLGISIGFMGVLAFIQLIGAFFILSYGAGSSLQAFILLLWLAFILLLTMRYYQNMKAWNNHQQSMISDLIERMLGHRTRRIQEPPNQRHQTEDAILSRYAYLSKKMDAIESLLDTVASRRGWLFISLIGLFYTYFSTQDMTILLISMGGILFAAGAFDSLKQSLRHFLDTLISWRQIKHLYSSAKFTEPATHEPFISPKQLKQQASHTPIIEAKQLSFAYNQRPILSNCDFSIQAGDNILLEGSSGSGKSTLAALLSGMMLPHSGSLKLSGFTLDKLGEKRWHKRIVISPQFHENHVISDSFMFNLLMGKRWPPTDEDIVEAETICRELELGTLLDTMPAGMQQMVGEAGWRLSHGEKSRLFIARTLLQEADLIILDESFAALDPETLQLALNCVLKRSNALLLIAHP